MPNWLFGLCLVSLCLVFVIVPWRVRRVGDLVHRFDLPDRALAYLALFAGFAVLVQQTADLHYGFVYMVSSNPAREAIDAVWKRVSGVSEGWLPVMTAAYWLFVAAALFFLVALVRGTFRDPREEKIEKLILDLIRNPGAWIPRLRGE